MPKVRHCQKHAFEMPEYYQNINHTQAIQMMSKYLKRYVDNSERKRRFKLIIGEKNMEAESVASSRYYQIFLRTSFKMLLSTASGKCCICLLENIDLRLLHLQWSLMFYLYFYNGRKVKLFRILCKGQPILYANAKQ
ncbi:hypothetical protein T07_14240 [Trichinella nelsoni]|uniref:Uncharacterized protein n=1 Tax=Trichinella nelsoni TaxID=6336 RepID=A0A0V0SIE5_9BILA|nr:hypothetical protein T07_14240 [Trichinella nelsoni]